MQTSHSDTAYTAFKEANFAEGKRTDGARAIHKATSSAAITSNKHRKAKWGNIVRIFVNRRWLHYEGLLFQLAFLYVLPF